jgi:glycine cleavage system aminomethyltransferase T
MKLPEYISKAEVKRVCKELRLRDWSKLKEIKVTGKEAATILRAVNIQNMSIPVEDFRQGLAVELEHGIRFDDANVTNNHPILTGKIVLAHLKETMDYYQRLEIAEIEGDLLKAVLAKDLKKIELKYKKLSAAQSLLNKAVLYQLKQIKN